MTLTPLEHAVLSAFHQDYADCDFPPPDAFGVVERENTGVGRFTKLSSTARPSVASPCIPGFMIEMDGLAGGISPMIWLSDDGSPDMLELVGYDNWDGSERPFRIVLVPELRDA